MYTDAFYKLLHPQTQNPPSKDQQRRHTTPDVKFDSVGASYAFYLPFSQNTGSMDSSHTLLLLSLLLLLLFYIGISSLSKKPLSLCPNSYCYC